MKKIFTIGILLTFNIFSLKSQDFNFEWGLLSDFEKNYTFCDYEPSANSVVLFDIGKTNISENTKTIHTRIKVLSDDLSDVSKITINYYSADNYETISDFEAQVINISENGSLNYSTISKEEIYKNYKGSGISQIIFAPSNLKKGSIIEYKYTINYPEYYFLSYEHWTFQTTIPTLYSKFTFVMYMSTEFISLLQGKMINEKYAENQTTSWELQNIPSIKHDSYCPDWSDYIEKITLQLSKFEDINGNTIEISNWEKLIFINFDNLKSLSNESFKDILTSIISETDSDSIKLEKIYNYVTSNYNWNGVYERYPENNVKKVNTIKSGNSAEINLVLYNLLDDADLDVYFVLSSTVDNGSINKDFPYNYQFNHLMTAVKIGENFIVVDGTNKFLPYTILDKNIVNSSVLAFKKNEYQWIELKMPTKNQFIAAKKMTLNENSQIITDYQLVYKGYYAENKRSQLSDYSEETLSEYYLTDLEADSISFINLKENDKDLIISETITSTCENNCKYLYYAPVNIEKFKKNPFIDETRNLPINFSYPFTEKYVVNLFYDSCYTVDELPENLQILLPRNGGVFKYQSIQSASGIQIVVDFKIYETIYTVEDYELVKDFFSQIVTKLNENIVFIKKEE